MVLLAGIALQVGTMRRAWAQISPGPLARPHESLDGPLKCMKCHAGKSEAMDKACLGCHQPIASLRNQGRGYHGVAGTGTCSTCHPDHAGRDFSLIKWDSGSPESFDHARAGWALEGKHAQVACRDCHQPRFQTGPYLNDIPPARRPLTWLGLETQCRSCHQDVHQGSLSADCATCHIPAGFKPATKFDHARSEFSLTGEHVNVACVKCHPNTALVPRSGGGVATLSVFKPQPHGDCSSCHKDPHQGRLGPKCSACHATDDFRHVTRSQFDHSRTKFALQGKHVNLECARCHDPVKAWGKRPAFAACASCHKDPHAGEATLEGRTVDCAACHDEQGFRPSTYTVARHANGVYPLVGRHAAMSCAACHPKVLTAPAAGSDIVRLRPKHATCRDCHPPAHAEQLSERPDKGACESCHTPAAWRPTLFDRVQHAALKLPLEGRHTKIACADCHGPRRRDLPALPGIDAIGKAGVVLHGLESACASCHIDVHAQPPKPSARPGRKPPIKTGAGKGAASCQECHSAVSFRPSRVDAAAHRAFAFPLEGAHQAVPCQACHGQLARSTGTATLLLSTPAPSPIPFGQESTLCADCHQTPHGAQFEGRRGGGDCEACHGVEAFRPADRFEHDRDTAFLLRGAHQWVACDRCHPVHAAPEPGAHPRVLYRSIDARCESCHARESLKP